MSLKLYRPAPGGLEPSPVEHRDWRRRLTSRRWRAAPLGNPDVKAVGPSGAILFFGGLLALTFVLLLLGYGSGFWG